MRWECDLVRRPLPAYRAMAPESGVTPARILLMFAVSVAFGFFLGERYLPRLDGGDISTVKMTYDQIARDRKSAMLKRVAVRRDPIQKTTRKQPRLAVESRPVTVPSVPEKTRTAGTLTNFFTALRGLDRGSRGDPVTILHLGDSHIASDRFTGDMRDLLQARFGDAGRGMMMPGFPFGYYRARGVTFKKSSSWTAKSSLYKGNGPYGLSGVKLSSSAKNAWLRLTSNRGAFEWAEVALLTGPRQGSVQIAVDRITKRVRTYSPDVGVIFERIPVKGTSLKLTVEGDGAVTILSWAIGLQRPGVRYVNFGIPSATANITDRWDDKIVAADIERLSPELIVLGYGTNEGFNDGLKRDAYELKVTNLIVKLQRLAPRANVLVIGPPDGARFPRALSRGSKNATLAARACRALDETEARAYGKLLRARDRRLARWHPPPKLEVVRAALKSAAVNTGSHFWDWSSVMGGQCGIHQWMKAEPKLAASDHVHITRAGSKRSAEALFTELMAGFSAHKVVAQR